MKLARFLVGDDIHIGAIEGDSVTSFTGRLPEVGTEMRALIRDWSRLRSRAEGQQGHADFQLSDIKLLAPIARPGKIWGIGLNYADHIGESGMGTPEFQTWFAKATTAVAGPTQKIERPRASEALDYEAELVVVIGEGGRNIPLDEANGAIFGYAAGNDFSVRDWQLRTGQFSIGKSFDTHAPFGPWIVTADEVDPLALNVRSFVNGELRQNSNTRYLIFTPADQVAHLSQAMTLEPGDLLFTGTPGGVGAAMTPPQFLRAGDRVRVEIDGIGAIENEVFDA